MKNKTISGAWAKGCVPTTTDAPLVKAIPLGQGFFLAGMFIMNIRAGEGPWTTFHNEMPAYIYREIRDPIEGSDGEVMIAYEVVGTLLCPVGPWCRAQFFANQMGLEVNHD